MGVDTRSDIVLTGCAPVRTSDGEYIEYRRMKEATFKISHMIKEEEPPKPSTRLSDSGEAWSISANRHMDPKPMHFQKNYIYSFSCIARSPSQRQATGAARFRAAGDHHRTRL